MKNVKKTKADLRDKVFINLDNFQKACEKTAKDWDLNSVPLLYIKEALRALKWTVKNTDNKTIKQFAHDYNKLRVKAYRCFIVKGREMGTNNISIGFIKNVVFTLKTAYDAGYKNK